MITLMSVNAWELYLHEGEPEHEQRYNALAELVDSYEPDILVTQEIMAPGRTCADKTPSAQARLRRWANATGAMRYDADGEPLLVVGGSWHHLAITYRDTCRHDPRGTIRPIPGTVRRLDRDSAGMWHGAVMVDFDIGGHLLRVGTTHLNPRDQDWCRHEARYVVDEMQHDGVPRAHRR